MLQIESVVHGDGFAGMWVHAGDERGTLHAFVV